MVIYISVINALKTGVIRELLANNGDKIGKQPALQHNSKVQRLIAFLHVNLARIKQSGLLTTERKYELQIRSTQ